jgi:hypothetical protein
LVHADEPFLLSVGFIPERVDLTEKVRAGVAAEIARLEDLGYDAHHVYLDVAAGAESDALSHVRADAQPPLETIGCVVRSISSILFPPPATAKEIDDDSMYL